MELNATFEKPFFMHKKLGFKLPPLLSALLAHVRDEVRIEQCLDPPGRLDEKFLAIAPLEVLLVPTELARDHLQVKID